MPIFFKPPAQPPPSQIEGVVVTALASDKIHDPNQRVRTAQQLLSQVPQQQSGSPVVWWRVAIAIAFLVVLFCLALWLSGKQNYAKLSDTVLHCFELAFTASLGLFGIEAVKHG